MMGIATLNRMDMPEPEKKGQELAFMARIQQQVLSVPPVLLGAREINGAAQVERRARMIDLARKSKYALTSYPLPQVHEQINLMMDEEDITDEMIKASSFLNKKDHEALED